MPTAQLLPARDREDIIGRLQRIEGQARGIQKMFDDDRECTDILNQVAAVKSAANSLSATMFEAFALYCLRHPDDFSSQEESIEEIVKTIVRAGK